MWQCTRSPIPCGITMQHSSTTTATNNAAWLFLFSFFDVVSKHHYNRNTTKCHNCFSFSWGNAKCNATALQACWHLDATKTLPPMPQIDCFSGDKCHQQQCSKVVNAAGCAALPPQKHCHLHCFFYTTSANTETLPPTPQVNFFMQNFNFGATNFQMPTNTIFQMPTTTIFWMTTTTLQTMTIWLFCIFNTSCTKPPVDGASHFVTITRITLHLAPNSTATSFQIASKKLPKTNHCRRCSNQPNCHCTLWQWPCTKTFFC